LKCSLKNEEGEFPVLNDETEEKIFFCSWGYLKGYYILFENIKYGILICLKDYFIDSFQIQISGKI
jgi:hypothetical protein